MDARQMNGLEIAARRRIERRGDKWIVPSQHGNGNYEVTVTPEAEDCPCDDFQMRRRRCKHIWAVHFLLERDSVSNDVPLILKEPIRADRPTYSQDWSAYNAAMCAEKRDFQHLLYDLCKGIEAPRPTRGRPPIPLSDTLFAAILRAFLTLSGRRATCDVENAAENGLISKAMHFNTINRLLRSPDVTPLLMRLVAESSRPLAALEDDVAVDSTGLSTGERVPWFDVKYGRSSDYTNWRKLHFVCGTRTHVVICAIPSPGHDHDDRFFRNLIEMIPPDFRLQALSADKAYLDAANFNLLEAIGIIPYIPFKRDSVSTDRHPTTWQYMHAYYDLHREEFLQAYHRRSNAESVVSLIKRKYGERLRCRTDTSQDNEILTRVIASNIFAVILSVYEHHLQPVFWAK